MIKMAFKIIFKGPNIRRCQISGPIIRRNLSATSSSDSSSIDNDFKRALAAMTKSPSNPPSSANSLPEVSNALKLELYALYKQSDVGPCNIPQPSMFDMVARAKYTAWQSLGNLSSVEAKRRYVAAVKLVFGGSIPSTTAAKQQSDLSSISEQAASTNPSQRTLQDIIFPFKKHDAPKESKLTSAVFESLQCHVDERGILAVQLNRPKRGNALNIGMLSALLSVYEEVKCDQSVKVAVLSGGGDNFSTGMDLTVFAELLGLISGPAAPGCDGRKREGLMRFIQYLQDVVSAPEKAAVPTIAAIHGSCIGGALDLVTACDLRYCTKDAQFCVKEIDLAIVADMGVLQRLPRIIGSQATAELALTARTFTGEEAARLGLVLRCFDTEEEMMTHVTTTAAAIAAKSPITTRGVKATLQYAGSHGVEDSLQQVKLWNGALLQSSDLAEAFTAATQKRAPVFSDDK